MSPLLLLLGAVVLASDDAKPAQLFPTGIKSITAATPTRAGPVWAATTVPPAASAPGSPLVKINKIIVADFRPTTGDYDDVHIPSACIPIVNFCTPDDIDVPLGFPKNHIPAGPLLAELASSNKGLVVWGAVQVRPKKGGSYGNDWRQGKLDEFGGVCMTVGYYGEAGIEETSDVPVVTVKGDATTASPECAFQVNPSLPRLTVAKEKGARRLLLWMPSYEGGSLRFQVTIAYRTVG